MLVMLWVSVSHSRKPLGSRWLFTLATPEGVVAGDLILVDAQDNTKIFFKKQNLEWVLLPRRSG